MVEAEREDADAALLYADPFSRYICATIVTDIRTAPAWEAVKYVNKRFVKEDIFYTMDETSPELDAVWLNLTGREYSHCNLQGPSAALY